VLDQGKILEQGTHNQLMANKAAYFELYEKQLLEEQETA
jgi:ATP-binding cassette subfamily B protein